MEEGSIEMPMPQDGHELQDTMEISDTDIENDNYVLKLEESYSEEQAVLDNSQDVADNDELDGRLEIAEESYEGEMDSPDGSLSLESHLLGTPGGALANGTLEFDDGDLSPSDDCDILPECRTKRLYACSYCTVRTWNPREYLYHLKDAHNEAFRIFECEKCVYASKSLQKLSRHTLMVHKVQADGPKKLIKKPMVSIPKKSFVNSIPMMRNARESKSPRRFEEYEFTDDLDEFDESVISNERSPVEPQKKIFACKQCDFVAHYAKVLSKHENKCHSKKKYYKCPECNYATPVRTRYSKHIKYHSLAVVKCEHCDFRTPYRWNLDRHMKNHSRQGGEFQCHLCNFRAQIKQSLTVHVANHHHGSHLQKNQPVIYQDEKISEEEMELLRLERDEDPDALEFTPQSFTVSNLNGSQTSIPKRDVEPKKPKIKMTFKKMKPKKQKLDVGTYGMDDDFVHPDDVRHRYGNVYIKNKKCNLCSFKSSSSAEFEKHVQNAHSLPEDNEPSMKKRRTSEQYEFHDDDIKTDVSYEEFMENDNAEGDDNTEDSSECTKKKPTFFDKLQEKISTTNVENLVCQYCGHESKCLSESVRHQKLHLSAQNNCASASLSTRCQFCRHRCKTTDDLVKHMKSCNEARKNQIVANQKKQDGESKHPMENRVFIWNNLDQYNATNAEASTTDKPPEMYDVSSLGLDAEKKTKTQYQCPQCNFNTVTPARFHAHMIGHDNRKPYSCSDCGYSSNWRWDITKHIRLKLSRKDSHKDAEVIIGDILKDTNYEKYNKYLVVIAVERKRVSKEPKDGNLPKKTRKKKVRDDNSLAVQSNIPAPPKLVRAPTRVPESPIKMSPTSNVDINSSTSYTNPPPLFAMNGSQTVNHSDPTSDDNMEDTDEQKTKYQIITSQGAMNTNLETLQLLASGSNNLDLLKGLQKNGEDTELTDADFFSQKEPEVNNEIMQLTRDHEGNPEWKCLSCDFRDNEQETVTQHVRLAHSKSGPVSLLHAVHKCSVCGYAAGTKRHVLLHIDSAHDGQGNIISKSEGKNSDGKSDEGKVYRCRICPFKSKKKSELKNHMSYHMPGTGLIFKCLFCEFFVQTKKELSAHLELHGVRSTANGNSADSSHFTMSQDETSPKPFTCEMCPFSTYSRPKLVHHRQFHRNKDLPYRCPHCSFNVTRRHLLAQHMKVHGIESEDLEVTQNGDISSKSPSPCLTITPIANKQSGIDPSHLPTLSDELTKNLKDIPLVWVSKERKYSKMFKCRHCPHVNLRKTNISDHEKMHVPDSLPPGVGHACQFCSFITVNAGALTNHMKAHSGTLGKCHAIVDNALQNEEQLRMLAGTYVESPPVKKSDEKLIYYCQQCPARFFFEKEVLIHSRFHSANNFSHQCEQCNYSVRDSQQLLAHFKVHEPAYQERTRTLMSMHPASPVYPPVAGNSVTAEVLKDVMTKSSVPDTVNGILSTTNQGPPPPTNKFKCDKCPSSFSKLVTLQYHQSLHTANNPFKCTKCTYAAKTQVGLDQHLELHERAEQAAATPEPPSPTKSIQETLNLLSGAKNKRSRSPDDLLQPPIKLKLSLKGDGTKKQFNYYIEEQVPLSGIDLLKRKNQIERDLPKDAYKTMKPEKNKGGRPPKTEDRVGNPSFYYPMQIDKTCGKTKEKRYKCAKCPSAFEKLDQFNVHINLHGSNYRYRCRICDYTVKFYANFKMHIKRHKYHERMDAQSRGMPPLADEDPKFQPLVCKAQSIVKEQKVNDEPAIKESKWESEVTSDMTTSEKQHLLLQEKKGEYIKGKEEDERKIFYCQHCPYANIRRDGVDSHGMRHVANSGRGVYSCNFCDYTAAQPNFIREHTKVHFRPFKYVTPEGFMKHEKMEIFSICSEDNGSTSKKLIVSHEDSKFLPPVEVKLKVDIAPLQNQDDLQLDNGVSVDMRSADICDAPANMK